MVTTNIKMFGMCQLVKYCSVKERSDVKIGQENFGKFAKIFSFQNFVSYSRWCKRKYYMFNKLNCRVPAVPMNYQSLCIKYKLSTLYGMLKLLHLQCYVLHKVFSIQ